MLHSILFKDNAWYFQIVMTLVKIYTLGTLWHYVYLCLHENWRYSSFAKFHTGIVTKSPRHSAVFLNWTPTTWTCTILTKRWRTMDGLLECFDILFST